MRTIYIDKDFKCYVSDDGTRTEIETDFFDNKCNAFIEGYRFVPSGYVWNNCKGEMITPYKDYNILRIYQEQYEEMIAEQEDMKAALALLGVEV